MYAFERFTQSAKKVLTEAQREAEAARLAHIGTEHLLLGHLQMEQGLARRVLDAAGVGLDGTREAIEAVVGHGSGSPTQIIPTPQVKTVIENAFQESQRLRHEHVGTHHLLLGLLIEGDGLAAKILGDHGLTLDHTRAEIGRLLGEGMSEEVQSPSFRPPTGARTWSPELRQLVLRAQLAAAQKETPMLEPDHVLDAIVNSPAGLELLSRLIELKRTTGLKEQAIAAQDLEAAARHQAEEESLRGPFEEALSAWRAQLTPPPHREEPREQRRGRP